MMRGSAASQAGLSSSFVTARKPRSPVSACTTKSALLYCIVFLGVLCTLAGVSAVPISPATKSTGEEVMAEVMSYLPERARDYVQGSGFGSAFVQSLLMTIVTELGDKTFFIAAILAMKHPRGLVLIGALLALYIMTILSVLMGKAFPLLFDKKYTSILAGLLFAYFGAVLLRDWYKSRNEDEHESEELQEVEQELERKSSADKADTGSGNNTLASVRGSQLQVMLMSLVSPILLRSFMLTFVAEWGDRSQIATIAFAAAQNAYGVILGCIIGHSMCTGLAVMGGRMLASRISERMVMLTGGLLFLLFAALTFAGKLD